MSSNKSKPTVRYEFLSENFYCQVTAVLMISYFPLCKFLGWGEEVKLDYLAHYYLGHVRRPFLKMDIVALFLYRHLSSILCFELKKKYPRITEHAELEG